MDLFRGNKCYKAIKKQAAIEELMVSPAKPSANIIALSGKLEIFN